MNSNLKALQQALQKKVDQLYETIHQTETVLAALDRRFFRVCIFGSARITEEHSDYRFVEQLSFELAMRGMDVITGGGPGLMEAANKGAQEGRMQGGNKVLSIGLSIELPFEESINAHLDVKRHHRRFSSRLDDFMRLSHTVVVTPGGVGTLLELFYCLQLIQVGHISPRPVILYNSEYWKGFVRWLNSKPLPRHLISKSDIATLSMADTIPEILSLVEGAKDIFLERAKGS